MQPRQAWKSSWKLKSPQSFNLFSFNLSPWETLQWSNWSWTCWSWLRNTSGSRNNSAKCFISVETLLGVDPWGGLQRLSPCCCWKHKQLPGFTRLRAFRRDLNIQAKLDFDSLVQQWVSSHLVHDLHEINWIEIRVITIPSISSPAIPSVCIRIHRYRSNTNMMHVEITPERIKSTVVLADKSSFWVYWVLSWEVWAHNSCPWHHALKQNCWLL